MANLPEKNITTVDKITEIPSNTMIFVNANGTFNQASIDDVLKAGNVINESIVNQFKTATGTTILATDSTEGNMVDFKGYGKSEQAQGNFFDGELLAGYYQHATGNFITDSAGRYVCSKNPKPCKASDVVKITYEERAMFLSVIFFDKNMAFISTTFLEVTTELSATAPTNAGYFYINIYNSTGITPSTAKTITVTVNGSTNYPSPLYPQRINAVGDKGWFDGELISGCYAGSDGKWVTNSTYVCNKNMIPCKYGDLIKMTYGGTADQFMVLFYDTDGNYITHIATTSSSDTFETNAVQNACYFNFNVRNTSGITPTTAKHITVTINGKYALIVKEYSKNFLNNQVVSQTKNGGSITVNKDKSITVNGTFTALTEIKIASNVEVKANEQILSGCPSGGSATTYEIQLYSASQGGAIARDFGSGRTTTISGIATAYLIIRSGVTVPNLTFYPMLRPVGTDDKYVPHENHTTYITISAPLRSSLDGSVKDVAYKSNDKYIVERQFADVVYDGSDDEKWTVNATNGRFMIGKPTGSITYDANTICTHLRYGTSGDGVIYIGTSNVAVSYSGVTTLEEWIALLQENPMKMQYRLVTTTIEVLDQEPFYQMKTFDGVTHITSEAEIEVEYPTSRTAGIASMGFAKGNLADIKMEQLSAQILEVQTALLNV